MDLTAVILVEIVYAVASLVLISAGLAVVFGMMKVINLAHGEFMMLGGYAAITAVNLGINVFVAMLVVAPLMVGLIGLVVERLVIRRLYGCLVDTMLATWGLSLFFIGGVTMIFGNTTTGISTPISGFAVGGYQINGYNFFIVLVAAVLLAAMYVVLTTTRLGLVARGTMQRPDMAAALGYSPDRVYMATFFAGSALSGLAARSHLPAAQAERRTQEVVERLALGRIASSRLDRLAHGERQQVELGIVAAADPWLVLLDEPAAGMSAGEVERMTEVIHEMNRTAAVVIVEHDMQFIRSIASRVTVFHQGAVLMEDHVDRVMADATVRDVYLGRKG